MREPKFRAWSIEYEEYIEDVIHDGSSWLEAHGYDYVAVSEIFDGDEFIVEQYTGLKDKNGKEIYGGDIILDIMNDIKSLVVWDEENLWFNNDAKPIDKNGRLPYTEMLASASARHFKVIGRIHENPELLEEEE